MQILQFFCKFLWYFIDYCLATLWFVLTAISISNFHLIIEKFVVNLKTGFSLFCLHIYHRRWKWYHVMRDYCPLDWLDIQRHLNIEFPVLLPLSKHHDRKNFINRRQNRVIKVVYLSNVIYDCDMLCIFLFQIDIEVISRYVLCTKPRFLRKDMVTYYFMRWFKTPTTVEGAQIYAPE